MRVKIVQWNIWFKENIERVADVLRTLDADIICLQELTQGYIDQTHENTWEYLKHQLGYACHVQEIPIITEEAQWLQANAIFSRYPIEHRRSRWLHTPHDDDDPHDQYRGYLETTLIIGDSRLTVGTTHMSFGTDRDDDPELQKLLSHVVTIPEHYVLTGDLNATPDSRRVQALLGPLRNAGPSLEASTWTTKPFHMPGFSATTLSWRYDYIFTTPDVRVLDAGTHDTDVSDHLPVVAVINLD